MRTRGAAVAGYSMLAIGLIFLLLAALAISFAPSLPASQTGDTDGGAEVKTGVIMQHAPPPYCPHETEDNPGKGKGPPDDTPGKGDPGDRGRPCGPKKK